MRSKHESDWSWRKKHWNSDTWIYLWHVSSPCPNGQTSQRAYFFNHCHFSTQVWVRLCVPLCMSLSWHQHLDSITSGMNLLFGPYKSTCWGKTQNSATFVFSAILERRISHDHRIRFVQTVCQTGPSEYPSWVPYMIFSDFIRTMYTYFCFKSGDYLKWDGKILSESEKFSCFSPLELVRRRLNDRLGERESTGRCKFSRCWCFSAKINVFIHSINTLIFFCLVLHHFGMLMYWSQLTCAGKYNLYCSGEGGSLSPVHYLPPDIYLNCVIIASNLFSITQMRPNSLLCIPDTLKYTTSYKKHYFLQCVEYEVKYVCAE